MAKRWGRGQLRSCGAGVPPAFFRQGGRLHQSFSRSEAVSGTRRSFTGQARSEGWQEIMERIVGGVTIRDIFLANGNWERFEEENAGRIRPAVRENVRKMLQCRTPELGFHMYSCPVCGEDRVVPHSCKSRMCSSCGKPATDQWAEAVLNRTLDVPYHHLVMSVPWQLRVVTLANRRVMLNILFRSAADAILEWCERYKGFTPGVTAVMHTFGGDLKFHPHVHLIVTGGGWSEEKGRWIGLTDGFLMPEAGLKKRWKFQVTSRMNAAYKAGELTMPRMEQDGRRRWKLGWIMSQVFKLIWYVMIGSCLKEIGFAVRYIGRYTRRPVIAEGRILRYDEKWVVFRCKDYAQGGKRVTKTLRVMDFIGRLVRHIPDKHFRMVRHYGVFANRVRGTKLAASRESLGQKKAELPAAPTWRERWEKRTGRDPLICTRCGMEMVLVGYFFGKHAELYAMLGLAPGERIEYRDTG